MNAEDDQKEIEEWRRRIDDLDGRLLELLNERTRCAQAIGVVKRRLGRKIYDPDREFAIVARAVAANPGPLRHDAVKRLFERILDESRRVERVESDASAPGSNDHKEKS